MFVVYAVFFFQAEDCIRDSQESRGLVDVYKRQLQMRRQLRRSCAPVAYVRVVQVVVHAGVCLLYTSDAADDLLCVDFGGSRIIKKKTQNKQKKQKNITLMMNTYNSKYNRQIPSWTR